MSRLHLAMAGAGVGGLLLLGALMWQRWGMLVWLDAAIAFCL
jgi:hypothetical protein